jgi:hypothetical protein
MIDHAHYGGEAPSPGWTDSAQRQLPPSGSKSDDPVALSPELQQQVSARCVECHDDEAFVDSSASAGRAVDLRAATLPRALVVKMLDRVAFEKMPKDRKMPRQERRELVRLLIDNLWADVDAKNEAAAYFLDQMRALPAQPIDNVLLNIAASTGADIDLNAGYIERAISMDQATLTPGFIGSAALQTLRACKTAGKTGIELDNCLEREETITRLTRGAIPLLVP